MPSQPEAQGDILKEFREGTFLSSLDTKAKDSQKFAEYIHRLKMSVYIPN